MIGRRVLGFVFILLWGAPAARGAKAPPPHQPAIEEQAAKLAPNAGARAAEAVAAMEAGRFDDAATIYAELVTSRPNDAGLLMKSSPRH